MQHTYDDREADELRREPHKPHVFCSVNVKGQIELRGSYDPYLMEFFQSLPNARWNTAKLCWTCTCTPATCWRIALMPLVSELAVHATVTPSDEIREAGHEFFRSTTQPPRFDQPPAATLVRKTLAWRHQCEAYWFAMCRKATLLAMSMGTGKSNVVVNIAQNDCAKRVLIICPVSVRGVWRREFAKHCDVPHNVLVLDTGTTAHKAAQVIMHLTLCQARHEMAVVVVNYESAWRGVLCAEFCKVQWDIVVCDESARIKSHNSAQSKGAAEIGRGAKRRLALSGTPLGNSPLDCYGQFRFLDAGIFGTSWHRFRNTYAISGPFGADHIVGYKHQDDLARKMRLLTYQVGAEVLDLPPMTHVDIEFDLSKDERRMQDELADEMITFLDGGGEVSCPNGLVKLLRLQTVTGGHVKRDEDGETISVGTSKEDTLFDLLQDINEPVVVFCRFREDLRRIQRVTERLNRIYGEISGERKDLTDHATMSAATEVMGVQHQSGGVGIDLTRARIGVLWNHPWSPGDYDQMLARIHRPGQERPVVYYHLLAIDSVDGVVAKALVKKTNVIDAVLSQLKGEGVAE